MPKTPLQTLEWQSTALTERFAVLKKTLGEKTVDTTVLLSRLQQASMRVREGAKTHVKVRGKRVQITTPEEKAKFHNLFEDECRVTESLLILLEEILGVQAPPKSAFVGGRLKRSQADPVIEKAQKLILKCLRKKGPQRRPEIVTYTGITIPIFRRAISSLVPEKVIKSGSRRMMTYAAIPLKGKKAKKATA